MILYAVMFIFEEIKNLSINTFELGFYGNQNLWKHKLTRFDNNESDSGKAFNILLDKNHYVLIEKLHLFSGYHKPKLVC